eukprot:TRINITY_DN22853_c0_g1_i1.p2 TRINITY_DN22853_c0_g1~~TRINITY_DN22853_c0_g1_i1.p2  ORF type:complete len:232 (-),score=91.42 TRINITY_DN22853_c0_g1_i1:127-822(-)
MLNRGAAVLRPLCRTALRSRPEARGFGSVQQSTPSQPATPLSQKLSVPSATPAPVVASPNRNVVRVARFNKKFKLEFSGSHTVTATGPLGTQSLKLPATFQQLPSTDGTVNYFVAAKELPQTVQTLISNLITGVCFGFHCELVMRGIGMKAFVMGKYLGLDIGNTHLIFVEIPEQVSMRVRKQRMLISGTDLHTVKQFAANIRAIRPPDPYKGKGIRYADENVKLKVKKGK